MILSEIAYSTSDGPRASRSGSASRVRRSALSWACSPRRTVITKWSPRKTITWPVATTSEVSVSSSCST